MSWKGLERPSRLGILRPVDGGDETQDVPLGRWFTVLAGVLCLLVPWRSVPLLSFGISSVLLVIVGATVCCLWTGSRRVAGTRALLVLVAGTIVVGGLGTMVLLVGQGAALAVVAPLVAVTVTVGILAVFSSESPKPVSLLAIAGVQAGLVATGVWFWSGNIDVERFVVGGLDALAGGHSPYAITIDNPHSAAVTEAIYGPGVVQNGRVMYGFPYLPSTLLIDLPVHVLADAVWMHMAVLAAAVALAWRLSIDRLGRACVLALGLSPSTPYLILNYWIEAVMVGFLAVTVWGLRHDRRWATAVGLGLLFSSKQYAIFFLPAVWSAFRRAGWRAALCAFALAAAILAAFVAMDPHAFYRSAVELQFIQPFRDDAVSLLPTLREALGGIPVWLQGLLPFTGLAASALVAMRTAPGPTAFSLCVGLGLLVSVSVSKVGFVNYYMFIGAALLLAGVTWPADDPVRTQRPAGTVVVS